MKKYYYLLALIVLYNGVACAQNKPAKFSFEKIIYHTMPTYGFGCTYYLQIDSSKNVLLYMESLCEGEYHNIVKSNGYYTATLSNKEYAELVKAIESTHPENVIQGDDLLIDRSQITIIIYGGGKRYFFQSQTLPKTFDDVQYNLYSIYREALFKKESKPFKTERLTN